MKYHEKALAKAWRGQQVDGENLITSQGQRLQVVYPGRESWDEGPDFRGAIMAVEGGELLKGDVELHIRANQWRSHGHHRNPLYNRVVLHVVLWNDNGDLTYLESGAKVPILELQSCLKAPLEEVSLMEGVDYAFHRHCRRGAAQLGPDALGEVLDRAGQDRFLWRTAQYEAVLSLGDPSQALYEGLMEALGYSKNKGAFKELAQRLPLSVLEGYAGGKPEDEALLILQALLLGEAGLLPSQRRSHRDGDEDGGIARSLEEIWRRWGAGDAMAEGSWRFFRVRPENLPPRRIAAAGYLLLRFLKRGLLESLEATIRDRKIRKAPRQLEEDLVVGPQGYWGRHYDFGVRARAETALIGLGRAAEMTVNGVLPFFWAKANGDEGLKQRVEELYSSYPKLPGNYITREMFQQLFPQGDARVVNSARRQQGLIHLYKGACWERSCSSCPIGGSQM
ncbi:MAG: DUF2851 family protein [Dehalococcoidia bacterium]